eukprot:scaffold11620_cov199-Skeletonema_dohrnii-CCMP3373.AAC.2
MNNEAAINDLYIDWMENGVDDYLAWGFAVFEYTIRYETSALNHANAGETTEVVIMGFEQVAEGLLIHQDWMLPLWGEFSAALARASARGVAIACLSMGHVELPLNVLILLAPALKVAPIKLLHLKNNGLRRDGIILLSKSIQMNQSLERLALKETHLLDVGCVVSLVEPSRHDNRLRSLSLDKCNIGLKGSLMSTLLHTLSLSNNIRNLSLAHNHIGANESEMIASYLATNPPINSLDLVGNLLSDADVVLITGALKANTTLRGLRLSGNPLGEASKVAISEAIYNISSLNAIHSSNHTCLVTSDFDIPDCNRYVSQNANRISKLLGVLFTEFAFTYLDDVPLAVVPYVLDFLQYPSFKLGLTRIFHLVRDWDTPMTNLRHMCEEKEVGSDMVK